jgi:ubiquinone/menaquinone biosynthesis C-methylase UbiE
MGDLYDATWGRAFAALYDRALKATEEGGLRARRAELLGSAVGDVIELGAGTGANLGLYPASVKSLTLVEPDPDMAKRLRAKAEGPAPEARLVEAPGEHLPFADASFDTAVVTLVLCTVPRPAEALAELARILRPDGKLLFIEHVRAEDARLARWQDRSARPWRFFADGCYCNRDTLATIEAAPFAIERVESGGLPKALPIIRPLISGTAIASRG